MIYVRDEFEYELDKYILVQLHTTCCKDQLVFKLLSNGKWFDMQKMEECSKEWNRLIEDAMAVKEKYLKKG